MALPLRLPPSPPRCCVREGRRPHPGDRHGVSADAQASATGCSSASASRPPTTIRRSAPTSPALIAPNTARSTPRAPGSLTFEMQDIPAIAAAAHARGALVADGQHLGDAALLPAVRARRRHLASRPAPSTSSATPTLMMGIITATERAGAVLEEAPGPSASAPAPRTIYLALRGLRTIGVRLRASRAPARSTSRDWLEARPEVARVLHPALPSDPEHAIWKRDFVGASGLFSHRAEAVPQKAVAAMLDGWSCSASARPGAATRAWCCRSTARRSHGDHVAARGADHPAAHRAGWPGRSRDDGARGDGGAEAATTVRMNRASPYSCPRRPAQTDRLAAPRKEIMRRLPFASPRGPCSGRRSRRCRSVALVERWIGEQRAAAAERGQCRS